MKLLIEWRRVGVRLRAMLLARPVDLRCNMLGLLGAALMSCTSGATIAPPVLASERAQLSPEVQHGNWGMSNIMAQQFRHLHTWWSAWVAIPIYNHPLSIYAGLFKVVQNL